MVGPSNYNPFPSAPVYPPPPAYGAPSYSGGSDYQYPQFPSAPPAPSQEPNADRSTVDDLQARFDMLKKQGYE